MTLNELISKRDLPREDELSGGFHALQRQMNRLFDDFFGDIGLRPWRGISPVQGFVPRLDVTETEKEILVTAELPGLEEKDLDLSITDGLLTVTGEKKKEQEDKNEHFYHVERSYGKFTRSVQLPCEVDEAKSDANFKNGVLKIRLPKTKTEQAKTKKISIKNE